MRQHFMNKQRVNIILISFIILMAPFACQKIESNKIPPVILLRGASIMTVKLGCEFVDPGFVVTDDIDSAFDIKIARNPEEIPDSAGTYFIKYTAEDSNGNFSIAERKVVVVYRESLEYDASYLVYDTLVSQQGTTSDFTSYDSRIIVRNTYPQWIEIMNFNNFGSNFKAFLTHDSAGTISVSFDLHDTVIGGGGFNYCDTTGFMLHYNVKTPDDTTFHRTSFFYK